MTNIIAWDILHGKEVVLNKTTFQWLGTAGFRITHDDVVFLIDPFFSRSEGAIPFQPLGPKDMQDASAVFLSHGHFDHLADVSAVVAESGAVVYCSHVAADTLLGKGVPAESIVRLCGGEELDMGSYGVRVVESRHITFDAALVMRTAPRVLKMRNLPMLQSASGMPSGPVMVFRFDLGGLTVVHMGSLGMVPEEVRIARLEEPDIFMPCLQGHTHICSRAALLTEAMRPRAVVPQHFDDFSPPISQWVEPMPFCAMVEKLAPGTPCYVPEINKTFDETDIFGAEE